LFLGSLSHLADLHLGQINGFSLGERGSHSLQQLLHLSPFNLSSISGIFKNYSSIFIKLTDMSSTLLIVTFHAERLCGGITIVGISKIVRGSKSKSLPPSHNKSMGDSGE